jgi:hypothetical protein
MNNEIVQFFQTNFSQLESLLVEVKKSLVQKKFNDQRAFTIISILYEYIKEEKVDFFISEFDTKFNEQNLSFILKNFIQEEMMNIIDYMSFMKTQKREEAIRLVDFEWKFVGISSLEKSELLPKIFLKLIFNNGKEQIIESDYANFKKLQEEFEESVNSFNNSYSRRLEKFSK